MIDRMSQVSFLVYQKYLIRSNRHPNEPNRLIIKFSQNGITSNLRIVALSPSKRLFLEGFFFSRKMFSILFSITLANNSVLL